MRAFVIAFGVVFVAEFGDKSQLIALTFATRHPPVLVLAGVSLAATALFAIAVGAGALLGSALPAGPIAIAAGVLFLVFAARALWFDRDDEESERARTGRSVVLAVATTFFLAELGDKTQLAAVALAAREGAIGTWAGATLGEIAADGLAIVAGRALGTRISQRTLRLFAAGTFAVFGVLLLVEGVRAL